MTVASDACKPFLVELQLFVNRGGVDIIANYKRIDEVLSKGSFSRLVSVDFQASCHAATHAGRVG
jgi:hypothetical protein